MELRRAEFTLWTPSTYVIDQSNINLEVPRVSFEHLFTVFLLPILLSAVNCNGAGTLNHLQNVEHYCIHNVKNYVLLIRRRYTMLKTIAFHCSR